MKIIDFISNRPWLTKDSKSKPVPISKSMPQWYREADRFAKMPNGEYWIADQCSKSIKGCKIRFGENPLPFGGFYGVSNYNRGVA